MSKRDFTYEIFGQTVEVVFVDLAKEREFKDSEKFIGDSDVLKRKIRIEKALPEDLAQRVIRHEKLHMKLALSGYTELLSDELEEALCVMEETAEEG